MGIRVSTITLRKQSKHLRDTTSFPISEYDKYLLKSSWGMLANKQLRFGIGLFYRLFTLRPDIAPKFTEFGEMESAEELKTWTELKGHPKKLAYAFNLAISCLDDANDFITKIESLGEKHLRKLKSEDMQFLELLQDTDTAVLCVSCSAVLSQPTGGRAKLTEGCSFRKKPR
eukprot:gene17223-18944_t